VERSSSGSPAEYVGSQFMQFGLQPAGENRWDGKPGYVQTVNIARRTFAENPVLKYGSTALNHGKDMVVLRTNTDAASGELQKLADGEKPKPGAVVFLRSIEGEDQRAFIQRAQALASAGASIVLIEETPQIRANWGNFGGRMPSFTSTGAKAAVVLVISKDAVNAIESAPVGIKFEFGGKLAPGQDQNTWNAVGKLVGSDPTLSSEVILISSHLDHLGVRPNAPGDDKLFNGADDDASGTVAVLELARLLGIRKASKTDGLFRCLRQRRGRRVRRELFVNNLPFPKEKLVANLEFEMLGRPDAKVKPEELWLTGYERSNLGPMLASKGAKLVQDPHPGREFLSAFGQLHSRPSGHHRPHGLKLWTAHRLSPSERRSKNDRLHSHDAVDKLDGRAHPLARKFQFRTCLDRRKEAVIQAMYSTVHKVSSHVTTMSYLSRGVKLVRYRSCICQRKSSMLTAKTS
jgi:hypothetical protein